MSQFSFATLAFLFNNRIFVVHRLPEEGLVTGNDKMHEAN